VLLTAEQGQPLFQARWEIDLLTKLLGRRSHKWIFEVEQDVAHIGHLFKRYTPIGVVGAISRGTYRAPFICQSTRCPAGGKHGCPKAVTVYAAVSNFRLHS
jgi:hypothetical protein